MTFGVVALSVFAIALFVAAASDLTTFEIPDQVSLVILAAFLGAVLARFPLAEVGWHLAAGIAVLVVGAGLFAMRLMGGGDVKLLAASSVWMGWQGLPRYIVLVAIAGGVVALVLIAARRLGRSGTAARPAWLRRLLGADEGVPYATAIAIGGWASLPALAAP